MDGKSPEYFEQEEYIRTLEIRPFEGTGVAVVHWWYRPDSYDQWIPLDNIEHTDPPDTGANDGLAKQWRVNCKFIRDVRVYHEWGNELDYSIEDDGDDSTMGSPRLSRSARRKSSVKKDTGVIGALVGTDKMNQGVLPPTEDPNNRSVLIVEVTPNATSNQYELKEVSVPRKTSGPRATIAEDHLAKRRKTLTKSTKPSLPEWFSPNIVHAIEAQFLPEFFSGHSTRTPAVYMRIRNMIHGLYQQNTSAYVSATDARKLVAGDVCTVLRIHEFLDAFSVINYSIPSDKRPSYAPFVPINSAAFSFLRDVNLKSKVNNQIVGFGDVSSAKLVWTQEIDEALLRAVSSTDGNWEEVSKSMKSLASLDSFTPHACMTRFAEMSINFSKRQQIEDPTVQHNLLSENIPSKLSALATVAVREATEHVSVEQAMQLSRIVAKVNISPTADPLFSPIYFNLFSLLYVHHFLIYMHI